MPRRKRRWGSGSVFEREGHWYARWRENGRHRCKSFVSKELAEAVLAKIVRDIQAGEGGLPKDRRDVPALDELAKAWLKRREKTHRSAKDDRCRWRVHLAPVFGRLKPFEVDAAKIRAFIEKELGKSKPATVSRCIGMLSSFFEDVKEQGHLAVNPIATLPRSTRRLYRSDYDTRSTPFLHSMADVRRVFLALSEPYCVAFACGALAGLRTGEVLGLSWPDIDLPGRRIRVHQQMQDGRLCGLKDDEPRIVPLLTDLVPILAAYRLKTGGQGLLFKPAVPDRGGRPELGTDPGFVRPQTLIAHLYKALKDCGLPKMTWYQCTRHTFASQWVMAGNPIETLSKILGHASVTTTEHYAHLRTDLFAEKAYDALKVDLARPAGDVVSISPSPVPNAGTMCTAHEDTEDENQAQVSVLTAHSGV